jgi:HK97 family phage major capsid protein
VGPDARDLGDGDVSVDDGLAERPYGTKPYGTKPYGTKPYGTKPYGTKPYGTKPYGTKPYGTKPYGTKPYGTKPYGGSRDGNGGLDPDAWSADVAELVCDRSAVIRLGATIVACDYEVQLPVFDVEAKYIEINEGRDPKPIKEKIQLDPRRFALDARVAVPNRRVPDIAENPELADAIKVDLADALALRADRAFLRGPGGGTEPRGIDGRAGELEKNGATVLALARAIATAARTREVPLRNPGWILAATTLDELTRLVTPDGLSVPDPQDGRTLDTYSLLRLDGADGGMFLGFPFIASAAAVAQQDPKDPRIFFSADWQDAWIGIDRELVTVDISAEAAVRTDETVIRASMYHDFTLRRTEAFVWAKA